MNPEQIPLCLDSSKTSVDIPIRINQTDPIIIELSRFDPNTNEEEIFRIPDKELKKMKRAEKGHSNTDPASAKTLSYTVKKPGVYRLNKVVDKTQLEVQRWSSDTLVVSCPRAAIRSLEANRCRGEASGLVLELNGTPPLKVKYTRILNKRDQVSSTRTVQPDDLLSPLGLQQPSDALVDPKNVDVSWSRTQHLEVPLDDILGDSGLWFYWVNEIEDACGNVVNYAQQPEDLERPLAKLPQHQASFSVHDRPQVVLEGCDTQEPLHVAKGRSIDLPIKYLHKEILESKHGPYKLSYSYRPHEDLVESAESPSPTFVQASLKDQHDLPSVRDPGWYSLDSISSKWCDGEVMEPSSCLLLNPPEPDLSIDSQEIPDKCAGRSVGLRVDLRFIGTPPFRVRYEIDSGNGRDIRFEQVNAMRKQIQLVPRDAGHYVYRFLDVGDAVYGSHSLQRKDLVLEQDVRPPASAFFVTTSRRIKACYEEPVTVDVKLQGDSPWTLEYELVHASKKRKEKRTVEQSLYSITTENLTGGGEYSLALVSVTDGLGCKVSLTDEVKIEVRRQRPKASFGQIDGKRSLLVPKVRDVSLPLRLTGESPWTVQVRNLNSSSKSGNSKAMHFSDNNAIFHAEEAGLYEITSISDADCPGTVDVSANRFDLAWIARPAVHIAEGSNVNRRSGIYHKGDVCEGDEDILGLNFTGTAPFVAKYEQLHKPTKGTSSVSRHTATAGTGLYTIHMDTSKAGSVQYKVTELGDNYYQHDKSNFDPLMVEQQVHSRPTASFVNSGKAYNFCNDQDAEQEPIPLTLKGAGPFHVEINVKHQSTGKVEVVSLPNVPGPKHNLHLPSRLLQLGNNRISIRKVRDARGCQRRTEDDSSYVLVQVSEAPTITPLESRTDYCVGDRISYALSGKAPFEVFYKFEGIERKATATSRTFRRIAEKPGIFTITAIADGEKAKCKANKEITKIIHEMPTVRISKGAVKSVDIHEGGTADIFFEFWGTPPFEFT